MCGCQSESGKSSIYSVKLFIIKTSVTKIQYIFNVTRVYIFLFLVVTIQFGHAVTHLVVLPILKASHCTIFSILWPEETLQKCWTQILSETENTVVSFDREVLNNLSIEPITWLAFRLTKPVTWSALDTSKWYF